MITLKSVFLTTGGNNFHYHQIGNVLESNSSIRQFFFLVLIAENKIKKIQLFFQNTLHSSGNLDGRARCRHCQNKINVEKNKRWIKRVKKKNLSGYINFKWCLFKILFNQKHKKPLF